MITIETLNRSPYFRVFFKSYRKELQVNARDLSRSLGKGDAYISQIESGRIKNVDEATARQLLNKIGTTQEDIDVVVYFYFHTESSRCQESLKRKTGLSISESSYDGTENLRKYQNTKEHLEREKDIFKKLELINFVVKRLISDDILASEKLIDELYTRSVEISLPVIQREHEELNKVIGLLKADNM
ncbi:helix-turn-helix transcriptional regulator [Bacillus pumilus]|uniref:helix-turn-helix domain-containing protein n=1 Tax=Bacillus pumilus TaxID=1408 RepID=UPI002FE2BF3E